MDNTLFMVRWWWHSKHQRTCPILTWCRTDNSMGAGTGGAGCASTHPGKNQGGQCQLWKYQPQQVDLLVAELDRRFNQPDMNKLLVIECPLVSDRGAVDHRSQSLLRLCWGWRGVTGTVTPIAVKETCRRHRREICRHRCFRLPLHRWYMRCLLLGTSPFPFCIC